MIKPLVTDELDSLVAMLCAKYPNARRDTVVALVHEVYQELATEATVTTHLIPLTLNRCRKRLADRASAA